METTLVLGHGALYAQDLNLIRCSPIDLDEWANAPYDSVDMRLETQPTFIANLSHLPWSFAKDASYDRIIDTCGAVLWHTFQKYTNNKFQTEVLRILKPGGSFFGRQGFVLQKPE